MAKQLMKGNEAVAEAAIRAGIRAYFGYPITPQTELLEWMSRRMPEEGRAFVQAESELAAINMVYGAACTGRRVMSSSSSPGISLMLEGISYMAGTEVPAVLVDVMRGGPGLGNIQPSQSDYNQIVHGGGHGDYHLIVLAPCSVQESIDLTVEAFDLAEKYRSIVVILSDGSIGQMMEAAELPPMVPFKTEFEDWAVDGAKGRERRFLTSIYMDAPAEEVTNMRLLNRWAKIRENEVRYKEYYLEDAEYAIIGFGSAGRVALSAVRQLREQGVKIGLLRPISLSPFPVDAIEALGKKVKGMLVVEMNTGQMLDDVLLATHGSVPVEFYGRTGGVIPFPDEVVSAVQRMIAGPVAKSGHPRDRWMKYMSFLS
jgi:2-oxoglutarate/2-oxoacid ferredoxin oxidoreductase subunit alpha